MVSHLVIGGSGFLGRALLRILGKNGLGTFASRRFPDGIAFDALTDRLPDTRDLPADLSHVFVLYGAVNPDLCFREPQLTRDVNVVAAIRLLDDVMSMGLIPVYMSTDYVFDGTRGNYDETEPLSPTTAYGRQKAEVEAWLREQERPFIICRASKIVSGDTDIHSVIGQWAIDIKAGKRMRCAMDQIFSPGYVDDIARAMLALADAGQTGIFHVAGNEALSRYGLAKLFTDSVSLVAPKIEVHLSECRLAEIPFAESRPLNTSLQTAKLTSATGSPFMPMRTLCKQVAEQQFG